MAPSHSNACVITFVVLYVSILGKMRIYLHFQSSLIAVVEFSLHRWLLLASLSDHGSWFHSKQQTVHQDIDLVCLEYSGFSTRMVITLRPRQHGRHIADDTFKRIFLNENVIISIKISLKFVPKGPNNNIPELVQIMAWRLPGDKPLSEAMMVSLLTHICVTRPQWVVHHITCYGKHQQHIAQDMISCMYWVFRGFEVRMALSSGPRVSYSTTQNTVLANRLLKINLTEIVIDFNSDLIPISRKYALSVATAVMCQRLHR